MKIPVLFFCALSVVALVSCNQKPQADPIANEQEIEKRVQERLADEHRSEQDRQLHERELQLAEKEKSLGEQQREVKQQRAEAGAREEREREERKAEPIPALPVEPVTQPVAQSYNLFYKALDPDGDWIQTDNYGYVWRPDIAARDPDWRPYTVGHWVYTEAGCTWVSDERFGWATYHYGRWARLRGVGWVWIPGEEWAAAWVSWRSNDDYVGWAPLPPEATLDRGAGIGDWADSRWNIAPATYVFVNIANFAAPVVKQVLIESVRNGTIINQTRNVTRITANNAIIVNHGPNFDALRNRTQQPLRQLKIELRGDTQHAAVERAGAIEMSAPLIKKTNAVIPPPRVKRQAVAAIEQAVPAVVPNISNNPSAAQIEQQQEAAAKTRELQQKALEIEQARQADALRKQQEAERQRIERAAQMNQAQAAQQTTTSPAPAVSNNPFAAQIEQQQAAAAKALELRQKAADADQVRQAEVLRKQQETAAALQLRQQEAIKIQQAQQAERQRILEQNLERATETRKLQEQALEQRKLQAEQLRQTREEAIKQRQTEKAQIAPVPPAQPQVVAPQPERTKGRKAEPTASPTPAP